MNRIYKSVWNEQTSTFVAVAENTKARGKRCSGGTNCSQAVFGWLQGLRLRSVALALLSAGVLTQPVMAQVTDGWELTVDGATPFHVIPGGAFSLNSGSNIVLTQTGSDVSFALNPDLNVTSVTATGAVKGATGEFTGQVSAGSVSAGTATFSGAIQAQSLAVTAGLTANTATVAGAVNAGSVNTGALTATGTSSLRAVNVNNNKISGLADATVSAASTEAVSGKVLYGALNSGTGMKYFHSNSTKADSVASGTDAVAIGPQAVGAGEAALAAGLLAQAAGKESVALGARAGTGNTVANGVMIGSDAGAQSKGSDLIAVGNKAGQHLEGSNNLAIGTAAGNFADPLEVDNTVAIGNQAQAKATGAIALGNSADVGLLATNAIAMGHNSTVAQDAAGATAVGSGATVWGVAGTAMGTGARSSGTGSTAIGNLAEASGSAAFAGGSGSKAFGSNSVAVGSGAMSNTTSGVSIGEGAGSNAGTPVIGNRFGQVAVGGLAGQGVYGGYNVALGYKSGSDITGDDTVSIGREAGNKLTGDRTVSIGYGANNLPGETGTGTPVAPPVKAAHAVAIGERSRSGADGSIALGSMATVVDYDIGGIAIGNQALVYAGTSTNAAAGGIALGDQSHVTHANSVAIGANSRSAETVGVGYGAPSGALLPSSSVSIGTVGGERRLSNLAAGRLDTDAVNVSQLKLLHGDLSSIVGGNLNWDSNGQMTGPTFIIKDENGADHSYTSIGSAFEAMRTGVAGTIAGLSAVTYSNPDRTLIDLDSTTGAPVRISNVAAGVGTNDAVNKGQLEQLESSLIANRQRYVSVNSSNNPNENNNGATGADAIAIGAVARGSGIGSTAIGLNSSAGGLTQANLTTAIGSHTEASGLGATALGTSATAASESSIAVGQESRVSDTANYSVAIGYKSEVMGDALAHTRGAVAIGEQARVTQEGGIAFGRNAYDQAVDGVAIGTNSRVDRAATRSMAMGSGSSASGSQSVALGYQASVSGSNSLALGQGSKTRASNAVGVGSAVEADGSRSVALGDKAKAGWIEEKQGPNGLIEYIMHGEGAMGVGAGSNASEDGGLALGFKAISEGVDASALGTNAQALAEASQAWGKDARASAEKSMAFGQGAIANETASKGLALGAGATVSASGAVALGAGSSTNAAYTSSTARYTNVVNQEATQGVISVGSSSEKRRITNLAGGQDANDAVNVAQLVKLDQDLTALGTNYVGNNFSSSNPTGTTIHKNLGQSLQILGGATTAGTYSGANVRTQVLNGQLQIQIAETPFFKGADMGSQKISNVAKGTAATDAVNLSQLTEAEAGLTTKGMGFAGQTGTALHRDLGQTLTVKGSNTNLATSTVGTDTLQIALSDDLVLDTVTTGDTKLSTAGVTVKGATGQPDVVLGNTGLTIGQVGVSNAGLKAFNVVINDQGINAGSQKITNVAKGTAATDAVNVSQLTEAEGGLTTKGMGFAAQTGTAVHRDLGETLKVVGSNANLATSTVGTDTLQIALSDDLVVDTVTTGDTKLSTAGVTVKGATGQPDVVLGNTGLTVGQVSVSNTGLTAFNVVINDQGINAGSQKITNVAKGTAATDAVNVSQLTEAEGGLTTKGMGFAAQTGTALHRDLGETLTVKGSNANLATSTVGTDTLQIALSDDLVLDTVTTGDTKLSTAGVTVKGATGQPDVVLGNTGLTIGQVGVSNAGLKAFNVVINDQGINAGSQKITNVAAGVAGTDAVNVSQLEGRDTGLTAKGMNFAGSTGTAVHRDLGETLKVVGSNANLATSTVGTDTLQIALSDDLVVDTVTTGDTKLSTAGVTVKGATGQPDVVLGNTGLTIGQVNVSSAGFKAFNVVINDQGINAGSQKITNVAAGVAGTDAVNVSQLDGRDTGLTAKGMNFAGSTGTAVHRDLGETLKVVGSNANLATSTVGTDTLQIALSDDLVLDTVTTGDTKLSTAGVTVKGATGQPDVVLGNTGLTIGQVNVSSAGFKAFNVVINDQGINAGSQKITNVAAGVLGTDAVNVSQLEDRDTGLTAKGMNFAGSTGTAVHRDLGETLKIVGSNNNLTTSGNGTDTLSIALSDDLELSSVTIKGTAGAPDVIMNNAGFAIGSNVALSNAGLRAGTVIVSATDNDITGLSNRTLTGPNFGKNGRAATEEQLNLVRGETQELADRAVKYDQNPDQSVNYGQVTMAGTESTDGGRTGGTGITNVARGDISANSTDAVNGSQIHEMGESVASGMGGGSKFVDGKLVTELTVGDKTYNNVNDALGGLNTDIENVTELANSGWNIQTNGDTASKVGPKDTVQFSNGDNIEISRSGLDVKVALAQDIKVNSVVAKSVTTNEVQIVGGPTINQGGIDMHDKTISNVADGQAPQDAVNVRQLSQATSNITNQFNNLDRRINKVENRANAGVAAAMATAGLPQAYVPGKSMFAVAGGAWNGESGYAMGLSTVTDSGSWVLKGTVAGSSRGDYGGSVGVGYQW